MIPADIRATLRDYERRGLIRAWLEQGPGHYIVSMGRGPNVRVSGQRDLDMLTGILSRKAAVR